MSLATERCGRCGAALVSMEADPEAVRAIRCSRCAGRDERSGTRTMALIACAALVVAVSAWQMLTA